MLDLATAIGYAYIKDGLVFFLIHLMILLFCIKTIIMMNDVKRLLTDWPDMPKNLSSRTSAQFLIRFMNGIMDMNPSPLAVSPDTIIDRLEHYVQSLIAQLHDRINLLLVIGVAGTVYGLFEFAYKAAEKLKPGRINQIMDLLGPILANALAKAFPVVFFGIIFTVFMRLWAAIPERNLNDALTGVSIKIREYAKKYRLPPVEERLTNILMNLEQTLEPLHDLEKTLGQVLTPVIAKFSKELRQTLNDVKDTLTDFDQGVKTFSDDVGELKQYVDRLTNVSDGLTKAFTTIPGLFDKTHKNLDELHRILRQAKHAITNLEKNTDKITENYRRTLSDSVSVFINKLNETTSDILKEHHKNLINMASSWSEKIIDDLNMIRESFKETTLEIKNISLNMEQYVKNFLENIFAELKPYLKDVGDKIYIYFKQLDDQIHIFSSDIEKYTRKVNEETQKIMITFREFAIQIDAFENHLADLHSSLEQIESRQDELLDKMQHMQIQHDSLLKRIISWFFSIFTKDK